MKEIFEILRDLPEVTLGGQETTGERIRELILNGIKYETVEQQLLEGQE